MSNLTHPGKYHIKEGILIERCPVCGTRVCRLIGSSEESGSPAKWRLVDYPDVHPLGETYGKPHKCKGALEKLQKGQRWLEPVVVPSGEPMPRLSELPGPKHPLKCQACGEGFIAPYINRWQECDEHDQPENIVVCLCDDCSERLIEPHPRFYTLLEKHQPRRGSMVECIPCKHRAGVSCAHPDPAEVKVSAQVKGRIFLDYSTPGGFRRGHSEPNIIGICCTGQKLKI